MVKVTKAIAVKRLGDVPQERLFWCQDGQALKNLEELEAALRRMDDETFRYHSSETKSDFSNWVGDVVGDEKLSRDLSKCRSQAEAAKCVADRIAWLKNKMTV